MLRFRYWLRESTDRINYHLNRLEGHPHQEFVKSYLKDNAHARSKYLDFASNHNKADGTSPEDLGSAIDYFHSAKANPRFPHPTDIGRAYSTHGEFTKTMANHVKSPISDQEAGFSHPDSKVVHNQNGVRISTLPTIGSAMATRDPKHTKLKSLRDNSWCATEPAGNYNIEPFDPSKPHYDDSIEPHPYFSYNDHHLVQHRDPNSSAIRSSMYGSTDGVNEYAEGEYELNNERQTGEGFGHDLPDHVRHELYYHGPFSIKGRVEHAPQHEIEKMIDGKKATEIPHDVLTSILSSNSPHAKRVISELGSSMNHLHQAAALQNPEIRKHLINTIGGSQNLNICEYAALKQNAAHDIMGALKPGSTLSPTTQRAVASAIRPEDEHMTTFREPNYEMLRKLIDSHGHKLDHKIQKDILGINLPAGTLPSTQERLRDPEAKENLLVKYALDKIGRENIDKRAIDFYKKSYPDHAKKLGF